LEAKKRLPPSPLFHLTASFFTSSQPRVSFFPPASISLLRKKKERSLSGPKIKKSNFHSHLHLEKVAFPQGTRRQFRRNGNSNEVHMWVSQEIKKEVENGDTFIKPRTDL